MDLAIDRAAQLGYADQLVRQLRAAIACGRLQPGDALPSVRATAVKLGIAPMTVSSAYQALVESGQAVRHRGRPLVVAPTAHRLSLEERMALLEPALREVARHAREAGLLPTAVLAALRRRLQ
ncbi:GntR family transcriptional regulator [Luteimonas soli]|uniref:GntR family transcriptional regulator n=1 Tax=Luteimonas soli TaxID=1648966 RepID=A0ABV7XJK2_9GAMM